MIYIENLIQTDTAEKSKNEILKSVLGDAYLCQQNETYRQRREMAQTLKIKFKKAEDAYNMASLLCLPQILKTKTAPYVENKKALMKLKIPKKKITMDDLTFLGVKENHLLHETSHIIMWLVAQKNLDLKQKSGLMTAFLLSESYANYSETIANCYAETELHKNYLMLNSFWSHSDKEVLLLQKLRKKHGSLITNTTLFLCFLYSNFLYKKISIYECEGIRVFLGNAAANLSVAEIKSLFAIAGQLNMHFVMRTGEIFWKTLGIEENLFQVLDFDPVDFIMDHPSLQKALLDLLAKD